MKQSQVISIGLGTAVGALAAYLGLRAGLPIRRISGLEARHRASLASLPGVKDVHFEVNFTSAFPQLLVSKSRVVVIATETSPELEARLPETVGGLPVKLVIKPSKEAAQPA